MNGKFIIYYIHILYSIGIAHISSSYCAVYCVLCAAVLIYAAVYRIFGNHAQMNSQKLRVKPQMKTIAIWLVARSSVTWSDTHRIASLHRSYVMAYLSMPSETIRGFYDFGQTSATCVCVCEKPLPRHHTNIYKI